MDADEREIYLYLKSWKHQFISAREISRRAGGKRRSRSEPEWAKPVLIRMVERKILEVDPAGHYRIKPRTKEQPKGTRWVSPQIARVLKESGKDFSTVVIEASEEELDDYYDKL